MKIDSHQHFWSYDEKQYPWIPKGSPLQRDWLPPDLAPLLKAAGLDGCVAVQARQSLEESRWLLELAEHHSIIKGVVGWVDLRATDVEADLTALAKHPKFRGVRHVVQDEPDNNFMLGADFLRGIGKLRALGLTYDLLVFPRQLPAAIEVVRRFPEQPFVLDHIAKPDIKSGVLSPWREQLRELAKYPNVCCKISGMVTEADHTAWRPEDFVPYLEVVFDAFGEDRLMYGSDWPVCLLAGSYERVHALADHAIRALGTMAWEKFLGRNAARFYSIAGQ
jgi:L-fuconolactonase